MKQRAFGRTGWEVSEVGFGCWGLGGGWGPRDDAGATAALQRALELGVNFFDTAYVYGEGRSEQILGEAIRRYRASRPSAPPVRIATKVPSKNMRWPATPDMKIGDCFPADWIIQCTETSLRRLGVERMDLQQMHVWTDAWVEADEWRKARDLLKQAGKIQCFGVSVNDHESDSALQLVATGEIDSVQVIYNLFEQRPAERLFPLCQEHGVAVIGRVPFDEGSLTGNFTPQTRFPRGDWRAGYFKGERLAETCERVERLRALLGPEAPDLPMLALKFALSHPAVCAVIPGMRRVANVEMNCTASNGAPLPAGTLRRLTEHAWPRNFYVGAWG